MLADPGVITNEIDNLVIYTIPGPRDLEGNVMLFCGIAADPTDTKEAKNFLPEDFGGKSAPHFIDLASSVGKLFKPEVMAEQEISHLALLTGGEDIGETMYFNGEAVKQRGVLLWYSAARNKYYFIHCRACALIIAQWLSGQQETWQKIATLAQLRPGSSALN